MKRTELERRDREVKKARKKEEVLERKVSKEGSSPSSTIGEYIDQLEDLFFHDETQIYNIAQSIEILELVENIKQALPAEKLETVMRKAIKKTGVKNKTKAFKELEELMS